MDREKVWVPVPGYEGKYEVSNDGEVKSLARFIDKKSRSGNPCRHFYGEKIMKQSADKDGHLKVALSNGDGKPVGRFVHSLVLTSFIGPRPEGMECCHGNGVASDNRLENLRWDTHANNNADRKAHGNYATGERHHMSKLTDAQREEAVRMLPYEAAKKFGISIERHYQMRRALGIRVDFRRGENRVGHKTGKGLSNANVQA